VSNLEIGHQSHRGLATLLFVWPIEVSLLVFALRLAPERPVAFLAQLSDYRAVALDASF